jgi:hypothetical protein
MTVTCRRLAPSESKASHFAGMLLVAQARLLTRLDTSEREDLVMLFRKALLGMLVIASFSVFFVATLYAQPDPFQPLNSEKEKSAAKPEPRIVPSSQCVSFVAENESASDQRAKITAALNSETQIDFHEAPLCDVVSFIRSSHDIPVVLDARAMDDVGLSADVPVTVALKGVSLRSALRLMLRDLELTYVVADGVLQFTTYEAAESQLLQHVYPVDDLADPDAVGASRLSALSDLIMNTIDAHTWEAQGGLGSVVPMDHLGVLVISQTNDVHERIADLIVTLRRVREMKQSE